MKLIETVYIGDDFCCIYSIDISEKFLNIRTRANQGVDELCMLSKEPLQTGQAYAFISNYKLFPNCFAQKENVDTIGFQEAVKTLKADYEMASHYKGWFQVK